MNKDKKLREVINDLGQHKDNAAIGVLERIGTNCEDDEVRSLTAQALINRNSFDSLSVVIAKQGKGINDLNTSVAMNTINCLLALENKEEVFKVLEDTQNNSEDEKIRETARSVKALMAFS